MEAGELVRIRLDLAYDGTNFSGWAAQPGLRTVQAEVEQALSTIMRTTIRVVVAGRTDAGVHARGQVCHADIPAQQWAGLPGRSDLPAHVAALRRLRGLLPEDISVRAVAVAPGGFDARFSAIWRRYSYTLAPRNVWVDPLLRTAVAPAGYELDVAAMNRAGGQLVGQHDFLSYCKPREGATTVRTLQKFTFTELESGLIRADVQADAFCHSMVRSLIGAAIAVGSGRKPEAWPAQVLAAAQRQAGVNVAPARGLVLEEVAYPHDELLAHQAQRARRRRHIADSYPGL